MRTICISLFFLFPFLILNAQQLEVINSGGGYLETEQGSITFSVGEVVIKTVTQDNVCFTHGFCQTYVTITGINEIPGLDYELIAYPNPTNNFVILKISRDRLTNLKYFLFDLNGRLLDSKNITSNETNIPFNFLIPSTYILKVFDNQVEVKTFKIIKSK